MAGVGRGVSLPDEDAFEWSLERCNELSWKSQGQPPEKTGQHRQTVIEITYVGSS